MKILLMWVYTWSYCRCGCTCDHIVGVAVRMNFVGMAIHMIIFVGYESVRVFILWM